MKSLKRLEAMMLVNRIESLKGIRRYIVWRNASQLGKNTNPDDVPIPELTSKELRPISHLPLSVQIAIIMLREGGEYPDAKGHFCEVDPNGFLIMSGRVTKCNGWTELKEAIRENSDTAEQTEGALEYLIKSELNFDILLVGPTE